jgi:hypothetical protein
LHPGAIKKCEQFKQQTTKHVFLMMTETEKLTNDEWNKNLEDEALSKSDPSSAAVEFLGNFTLLIARKNKR